MLPRFLNYKLIVMKANKYIFWFEDEGKDGFNFEISASCVDEAYLKAYNAHGPQVVDMLYQEVKQDALIKADVFFGGEELEEYPCQQLLGGSGAAIYSNTDGLCKHPECNPEKQTQ